MKVVILAGGLGTRISEESHLKPKPMIEIGEMPILWHIMKEYYSQGFDDFVICLGYKGYKIKEFFNDYNLYTSDVTFDFSNNSIEVNNSNSEKWKVTLVDTGLNTLTAGRLKRVRKYLNEEPFMITYGDGVSDIDINKLLEFHNSHNEIVTITTYNFGQRFGVVDVDSNGVVTEFREKKTTDGSLINAGYMVMEPEVFNFFPEESDDLMLEELLETLAKERKLNTYTHTGFWFGMDTQRDKKQLEDMWRSGNAKWKRWDD